MSVEQGLLAPRKLTEEQLEQKQKLIDAGNEAFDKEDYQRAMTCYHRASVLDPSDAETWNLLGLTYANLDYAKEAWRSFKLALVADPDNTDTLWYAGEFLYNMEDFEVAAIMLNRFLQFEGDSDSRSEAEEMLKDIKLQLPDDDEEGREFDDDDDEEEDMDSDFDSFDIDDDEILVDEDEDFEDLADELVEWDGENADAQFVASVELRLSGMEHKCKQCGVMLPLDAPYCLSCFNPCFYDT